jgi:hypothetical protein
MYKEFRKHIYSLMKHVGFFLLRTLVAGSSVVVNISASSLRIAHLCVLNLNSGTILPLPVTVMLWGKLNLESVYVPGE